jgi:hypothetical protein
MSRARGPRYKRSECNVELEGTIGTFSLRELVEMVVYSSVTGVLVIGEGESAGQLFFRDGLPYDASCNALGGFDAAALLFNSAGMPFRFLAGNTSPQETLWMDPWELIERGEERARQWAYLQPYIPSIDWVPMLRPNAGSDHVHISEETWPVLSAVDGQRSVTQIADYLNLALVDTCQALAKLVEQKLLIMHAPNTPAPEFAVPRVEAVPAPESNGFFERLIVRTLEEERRRTSEQNIEQISDAVVRGRSGQRS